MKHKIAAAKDTVKKHPKKSIGLAVIASALIAESSGLPVPLVDTGVQIAISFFKNLTSGAPKSNAAEQPAPASEARSPEKH